MQNLENKLLRRNNTSQHSFMSKIQMLQNGLISPSTGQKGKRQTSFFTDFRRGPQTWQKTLGFQNIYEVKLFHVELKWQQQNVIYLYVYYTYRFHYTPQVNPWFKTNGSKLYSCPSPLKSFNSDPWDLPPTLTTSVSGWPHNTATASRKCRTLPPLALLVFLCG